MKYVLDTHVWIWWHMCPKKLSKKAHTAISNAHQYQELFLSAISVWEFCKLIEKQRLAISCDTQEWIAQALDMPKLTLMPLTPGIAYKSTILPLPLHADPADQLIIATAREENATLITADARLQSYGHVKTLW